MRFEGKIQEKISLGAMYVVFVLTLGFFKL